MSKPITVDQKVAELKRELGFRHSVYTGQVASGRMTREEKDYRIAVIEAIIQDYEQNKPVVKQQTLF